MDGLDRRVVRFGTFEADFAAGELRKAGRRVPIQEQPFRLLLALLEQPGEVVARAELQRKIWVDTTVDFEEGLNTAVRKLREALGDSATSPRFIETLPRRGYRFIAPTKTEGDGVPASLPVSQTSRGLGPKWWVAAGGIAVAVIVAGVLTRFQRSGEGPTLVASPPVQLTRDSGLSTEPVISGDGKLLVYASDRGGEGNLDIWIQHTAGGEPARLTDDAADDHQPEISPDGSTVLFRSERNPPGIYSVPVLGGETRLLIKGGYVPRFSPDGSRIAYGTGLFGAGAFAGRINVYTPATGATQAITPGVASAGPVTWSPDGEWLAFVGSGNLLLRPLHLWFASTKNGQAARMSERDLAEDPSVFGQIGVVSLAWFDTQIIFSLRERDNSNLWAATIDPQTHHVTGDFKRLTLGSGTEVLPSVSREGKLVFASSTYFSSILEATLGKDPSSPVTRHLTQDRARNYRPSLSADGTKLAYISDRSGRLDVWLRDLRTGKETALTRGEKAPNFAAISRDGRQVAFWDGKAIFLVPSGGGSPQLLCERCGRPDDWTEDGKILMAPGLDLNYISVRDPSTGSYTRIAAHTKRYTTAPDLSPDGKWLTFHIAEETDQRVRGKRTIFVAPYNGVWVAESDWIAITDGEGLDREPRWSSDGNRVYFLSDRENSRCIWARNLDPRTKQPLGSIFPVLHLHESRLSLMHIPNTGNVSLQAVGDKLIFAAGEVSGNVWMTDLRRK